MKMSDPDDLGTKVDIETLLKIETRTASKNEWMQAPSSIDHAILDDLGLEENGTRTHSVVMDKIKERLEK